MQRHGLQVAGDAAVGGGVAGGAEAAGDFLFDLGHAEVALGAVIGERHIGVAGEAEYFGFILDEGLMQVLGIGFGGASALAGEAFRGCGEFPFGLCQDSTVTGAHGLVVGLAERFVLLLAHLSAGREQEVAHPFCPGMAVGLFDEGQVAQQVAAAQGVFARLKGKVAGPAVVDEDAAVARDDADVLEGVTAPLVAAVFDDQVAGADAVCSQCCLRSMRKDVSSACSTGSVSRRAMAALSHPARASCRRVSQTSRVASVMARPVSAWRVWAARLRERICAVRRCVAKATMPGPYCRGPGISSGNAPRVSVRQRGQVFISASTVSSRVSKTISTWTRRSWPLGTIPSRSCPQSRHSVTGTWRVAVHQLGAVEREVR